MTGKTGDTWPCSWVEGVCMTQIMLLIEFC